MRIKQTYRHEGNAAASDGRGYPVHRYVPDKRGVAQTLTLTQRQFERLGSPIELDVVIRAGGASASK